jgi:hypothetical protein
MLALSVDLPRTGYDMTKKHTGRIEDTLDINVGGVDNPHYYGHVQVANDPLALSASH